jgi:hypothetical protein
VDFFRKDFTDATILSPLRGSQVAIVPDYLFYKKMQIVLVQVLPGHHMPASGGSGGDAKGAIMTYEICFLRDKKIHWRFSFSLVLASQNKNPENSSDSGRPELQGTGRVKKRDFLTNSPLPPAATGGL